MSTKRTSTRVKTGAGLLLLATTLVAAVVVAIALVSSAAAAPRVGTVTVGAQSGTPAAGTSGVATFVVSVAKGDQFSLTADLAPSGLPDGVTVAIAPSSLVWGSFIPAGDVKTATLTVTTTALTPAGVTPFTVKAQRNGDVNDFAIGAGTLTVLGATGNPQTIAFGPLPDRSAGDADFSVSATASSGLLVSFAASGSCTVSVATVHLTGAGSCTITASQTGNGVYAAATAVDRTFSVVALVSAIDLWAVKGTTTLPGGATVPVWGYNTTNAPVSAPGGPTLVVTEDQPMTIRLHNEVGEQTALLVPGQSMIPDATGASPGSTRLYTFTPNRPGTYLYEAGLLPNAEHQGAMGLYGALVVRPHDLGGAPIATQAYTSTATDFDEEAVLLLGEIDPALNNLADPSTFDLRHFSPTYFLINGKAYPDTAPIPTTAGHKVLLRYVNAGNQYHSMELLGGRQSLVGIDGSALTDARSYVAETFGPGQTADVIVTVPASESAGKLAVYDGSLLLHNSNTAGLGGMMTFLSYVGSGGAGDATGPTTSSVAYAAGILTATVSDATTGGSTVSGAEYFVDAVGAPGTGSAMNAVTAPFDAVTENVRIVVAPVLTAGSHTLYVRGRDAASNWGAVSSVLVTGADTTGPATTGATLDPTPTNGTVAVAVHATGDDVATGGSNIAAAEYFVDAVGANGTGSAMTVNLPAPTASLDGTIPAAAVNALGAGAHVVSIHSRDAAGNWGPFTTVSVSVDKTGPTTTGVAAAPNPNNGTLAFNAGTPVVRVTASISDAASKLVRGEAFVDSAAANGTGIPLVASDGVFNTGTEAVYVDIPLATIAQLANGNHSIFVHGQDAAGNWGASVSATLLIDKLVPTFTGLTLTPNPTLGAATVTVTPTGATDPGGAGVAGGEYWLNPPTTIAPAPGGGTQFTGPTAAIPTASLATGTYTVSVRLRDAAGNWSAVRTATLTVVPDAIFANGFETATGAARPWGWTSASTNTASRLNVVAAAALGGSLGLQAQGNNTNYVQFDFGTAANPASGTFDARFFFNPHGNTGTNQDVFVARTGGTTVFRVRYRMNAGQSQAQIQVGTGTANAVWTNLTNNASNRIEVVWQSGGTLQLTLNGTLAQTLTATATTVNGFRLGSVTSGGNATLEYFDQLAAKRSPTPLIGP